MQGGRAVDIAIIGGGAAGLFAAAFLSKSLSENKKELSVVLLEKMPRPGRKINITGKGRCNLTTNSSWEEFAPHVHPNAKFLQKAFYTMSPADTIALFGEMGLQTVETRGRRFFPKSMRAMDVTDTLVGAIERGGVVKMVTGCPVTSIERVLSDRSFIIKTSKGEYTASNVLVSTGGLSYPSTGSSGDGYRFASELGHTITRTLPSLSALMPEGYSDGGQLTKSGAKLNGLKLKNIAVALVVSGSVVQEEFGDMDFTEDGIEGAIGFRLSRRAIVSLSEGQKVSVLVDLKPALSQEQLRERIKRESAGGNNRLDFLLSKLLPQQMIPEFLSHNKDLIGMSNGEAALALPVRLKNLNFNITGYTGYNRCVVTNGGVSLKEVSPASMESKLCPSLFFAGEVLDLDCDTGGYNLQTAFSTAALAVTSMLKKP